MRQPSLTLAQGGVTWIGLRHHHPPTFKLLSNFQATYCNEKNLLIYWKEQKSKAKGRFKKITALFFMEFSITLRPPSLFFGKQHLFSAFFQAIYNQHFTIYGKLWKMGCPPPIMENSIKNAVSFINLGTFLDKDFAPPPSKVCNRIF